MIDKKNSKLR